MSERLPFPFVVGCGRSGTTLVRALLDAHPDLAVPDESYFPVWFARKRDRYESDHGFALAKFLDDLLGHEQFSRWGLAPETVRAALTAAAPTDYPDAIRACFQLYATEHGKPRYGDKTPVFVIHLPLLARLFPEAVFIHLIRDGRDVALSRKEASWGTKRLDHEALLWRTQVERGHADGVALGNARYLEIRYEDLLDDPQRIARDLCAFIGLDFDPSMLNYYERAAPLVGTLAIPTEHQNVLRPPTKGLRDWRSQLTPAQAARFEAMAGTTLHRFGYERTTDVIPPAARLGALAARGRYAATMRYRSAKTAIWNAMHPSARVTPPFPFVVGCDRSGTTLLRALLDSHPAMAVPSESYFPAGLLRNRAQFEQAGAVDVDAVLDNLRPRVRWQQWDLPEPEVREILAADDVRDIPMVIRSLYHAYARHAGKDRYGDKTPKFVFDMDLFAAALPESVFVHIVRDGRDVALSRRAAGWQSRKLASEARRWCAHVEHGRDRGRRLGADRYLEVRYEDLVAEPEPHARALCDFLGLEWSPEMLRYHERAPEIVSSVRHPELHQNISRPPTAGLRSWSTEMSAADIREYDAVAHKTLTAFGYPSGTQGIGLVDRVRAAVTRTRWVVARSEHKLHSDDRAR